MQNNHVNDVARDMLLGLPGVNIYNARKIMNQCPSIIAHLSKKLPRYSYQTSLMEGCIHLIKWIVAFF